MKTIIFDMDGTLSDVEHRKHHLPNWPKFFDEMGKDPPVSEIVWLADKLLHSAIYSDSDGNPVDFRVIVVTARPEEYRKQTERWLQNHLRWYAWIDKIYMRKDRDYRKDTIVKSEMLQQIIDDGYEPFLAVDDRPEVVDMWRSFGIRTLQCASDEIKPKNDGQSFLTMLVGPSGAGKSTYAAKNHKPHEILSTDAIREEQGWGHHPDDLARTFSYAHSLIRARLDNHIPTVFDATNLKQKDRIAVLRSVPKGQYVRYVVIDRSYDVKMADRGNRSEELVHKHHKLFHKELPNILNGDSQPNVVVEDKR